MIKGLLLIVSNATQTVYYVRVQHNYFLICLVTVLSQANRFWKPVGVEMGTTFSRGHTVKIVSPPFLKGPT